MPGPADLFREIHRLRRYGHELQEQIDRVPRQLKTHQAKVARQQELQREGQDAIKRLKVSALEKEGQLKAAHGQIAKHQKQLNEATSKKEYDALKVEIDQDKQKTATLEEEILQALTESEDGAAKLPELEKAVRQAKEDYARYEKGTEERLTDLRSQLAEARQQLATVEEQLPEAVRQQYNRIINAMGSDSLAAVQSNRICSACYTEITAQNYNDVLQGQFVLCKSCGRVLYLPA